MEKYMDLGIFMVGGCCGTTPEYIKKLKQTFDGCIPKKRNYTRVSTVSSPLDALTVDDVVIIGERINPTGKKLMRQALQNGDTGYILNQASEQADAGAEILDVNVGAPGIDEKQVLPKIIRQIQAVCRLPLQIDSSDPDAIEAALRIYNGKPIVNSVNGNEESLTKILPAVKNYGAAVVGLTLDENGIPDSAEGRFKIAEKILNAALSYGIKKEDVYIDCLTLTASSKQSVVPQTLKAVKMVKEKLGLKTVLGVSNISFGLPNRELLNHSFLTAALFSGLDMPILNPNVKSMTDAVNAYRVLSGFDRQSQDYIGIYSQTEINSYVKPESKITLKAKTEPAPSADENKELIPEDDCIALKTAVEKGLSDSAAEICMRLLEKKEPQEIIQNIIIPALDTVGNGFESGRLFLPQLLQCANAAQRAFEEIKKAIPASSEYPAKGPIVIATVKGDIHDIGKNIVKVILENYGYRVIDLGRDVAPETVVQAAKDNNAPLVGLSALMTTTLKSMAQTVEMLHKSGCRCRIMVGGAVLTHEYAMKIGADYYAEDAAKSVEIVRRVIG